MAKSNKKVNEETLVEETLVEETLVEETLVEETLVEETLVEEKVVEEKVVEDDTPPHVDVKPDVIVIPKKLGTTKGIIFNCNALRLREGANIKTKELAIIPVNTEVEINLDNSTHSFYEVTYTSGQTLLIGFCLKEFIKVG